MLLRISLNICDFGIVLVNTVISNCIHISKSNVNFLSISGQNFCCFTHTHTHVYVHTQCIVIIAAPHSILSFPEILYHISLPTSCLPDLWLINTLLWHHYCAWITYQWPNPKVTLPLLAIINWQL